MVLQTERHNGGFMQQSYSAHQGPTGGYSNYHHVSEYTSPYSGSFRVPTYQSGYGPHHTSGWLSDTDRYGSGANHYAGSKIPAPVKPRLDGYGSSYFESSHMHKNPHQIHNFENTSAHENAHHYGHGSPHSQGHGNRIGIGSAIKTQFNKLANGHNNYENTNSHENSHYYGHGSPHNQGHGHGSHLGFGDAIKTKINNMTTGHNKYTYENSHGYGHGSPGGFGHNTYESGNYGHGQNGTNHGYPQHSWTMKSLDDDE